MVKTLTADADHPTESLGFLRALIVITAGLTLLLSGLAVNPAMSADYTPPLLRSWQRAHEGHLTIEWAKTVRVQQKRDGDRLIIRFAEPLGVDIASTLRDLSNFVDPAQSTIANTDLLLALRPGVLSEVNIREKRIVAVDFTRDPTLTPQTRIETSTINNGVRLTLDWPGPTLVKADQASNALDLALAPGWDIDPTELAELQDTLRPWFSGLNLKKDQDRTTLSFILEPQIVSSVRSDGPMRTVVDLLRSASTPPAATTQPVARVIIPEKKPKTQTVATEISNVEPPIPKKRPASTIDESEVVVRVDEEKKVTTVAKASDDLPKALVFDWSQPVAVAVFLRADHLWAVFDEPDARFLSGLPMPPAAFGPGSFVPADGGTALRYPLRKPAGIRVSQTAEGQWQIDTLSSSSTPRSVDIERVDGSEALRATLPSGKRIVSVIDPAVGDRIDILPLSDAEIGQPARRRFVDLELLPTAQGLAWRPLNDGLIASLNDRSLEFHSSNGLSLSTITPDPSTSGPKIIKAMARKAPAKGDVAPDSEDPPSGSLEQPPSPVAKIDRDQPAETTKPASYFDLAGSGVERELVNEFRRIRRQAIRKADPENRDHARLNLARLLVSERLASEARTILNTVSDEADNNIVLQKRALTGVSALLIGHLTEASSLLLDPDLDNDDEIALWRAALESIEEKWQTAAEHWRAKSKILDTYPPKLKLDLGLMALRAAIETDDDKMVRRGLRRLASLPLNPYDQARFDAVKALKAERSGDLERARTLLTDLTGSTNTKVRTLADFELAALSLEAAPHDVDTLAFLDRSMPLWRGHPNERTMLDRLARRHMDANALRKALTIWRRLIHISRSCEQRRPEKGTAERFRTGTKQPTRTHDQSCRRLCNLSRLHRSPSGRS